MMKRKATQLLALLFTLVFLSACGGSSGSSSAAPVQSTASPGSAPGTSGAPLSAQDQACVDRNLLPGKPFSGAQITFMSNTPTDAQFALLDKYAQSEFKELTGIEVTFSKDPYDGFSQKLLTEAMAGDGTYDCYMWNAQWGPPIVNYMEPLDSYIERDSFDVTDYPAGLKVQAQHGTDTWIGLPFRANYKVLYYRKDLFEKHGIDVPGTWDEFRDVCATLQEKEPDMSPISLPYSMSNNVNLTNWYIFLYGNGSGLFDDDWNPLFANEAGIQATQDYIDLLVKYNYVSAGSVGFNETEAQTEMAQGYSAMFIGWCWMYGNYTNPDITAEGVLGNIGAMDVPGYTAGQPTSSYCNTFNVGIPKNSTQKDASWEFIKWVCSPLTEKELILDKSEYDNVQAAHIATLLDPEVNATTDGMHTMGVSSLENAIPLPQISEWGQVAGELSKAINLAASGDDVEKAMKDAEARIIQIMKEGGHIT